MTKWFIYAPLSRFVVKLAEGWNLQDVCEPMHGPHSRHAILMWRLDEPR